MYLILVEILAIFSEVLSTNIEVTASFLYWSANVLGKHSAELHLQPLLCSNTACRYFIVNVCIRSSGRLVYPPFTSFSVYPCVVFLCLFTVLKQWWICTCKLSFFPATFNRLSLFYMSNDLTVDMTWEVLYCSKCCLYLSDIFPDYFYYDFPGDNFYAFFMKFFCAHGSLICSFLLLYSGQCLNFLIAWLYVQVSIFWPHLWYILLAFNRAFTWHWGFHFLTKIRNFLKIILWRVER